MTQRITTQMVDNSTVNAIDNDLNQLDQTQEELSTGFQINEPSDNPVGASITLSLQDQISSYSQYQENISEGSAVAGTESSSLSQILSTVQGAQELVTEAANGTLNSSDLQDAAAQVLQYIGEIKETANTQYDGSYVFSGSSVNTAPYDADSSGADTFEGNTDSISYGIGPSTQLPVSANLYNVLGNGTTTGTAAASNGGGAVNADGSGGLLATLRTVYSDLESGNQNDLQNQITNLQTNQDSLLDLQANVGATQDRLQMASSRITSLSATDTTELSNVYDTDMPVATTQFSTEQAGYEAALQSTADIIQTSLLNFLST
jgi:flagellar hook-associated protein 3 FlgL